MDVVFVGTVAEFKKFLADILVKEALLQSRIALAKWMKK